jgi:hypothetical protein
MNCCDMMKSQLNYICPEHWTNKYSCPDFLIDHIEKFDEYWIIIHDWWVSKIDINFCPWCWKKIPVSKRNLWFDEIYWMWLDPRENKIPEKYNSKERYQSI